jgi:hypothetical protein
MWFCHLHSTKEVPYGLSRYMFNFILQSAAYIYFLFYHSFHFQTMFCVVKSVTKTGGRIRAFQGGETMGWRHWKLTMTATSHIPFKRLRIEQAFISSATRGTAGRKNYTFKLHDQQGIFYTKTGEKETADRARSTLSRSEKTTQGGENRLFEGNRLTH